METLIIIILLAILAVSAILLVWVKVSTGKSIREVLNKLNALHLRVNQIGEERKVTSKQAILDDNVTFDESLITLMDKN